MNSDQWWPPVDSRVSVRYRMEGNGDAGQVTDVVGHLIARDPIVVRGKTDVTTVPEDHVVAIREIPLRPVRTSAIRDIEVAAAHHWPGLEFAHVENWLCRYSPGDGHRANSAVCIDGDASTLVAVQQWYEDRDAVCQLAIADRGLESLGRPQVTSRTEVLLLPHLTETFLQSDTDISTTPTRQWSALYPGRSDVACRGAEGTEVSFVSVIDNGVTVGIARVAVSVGRPHLAGISCVEVHPEHRRRGIGRRVVSAAHTSARQLGASSAYVQVSLKNFPARRLLRSVGYGLHHTYGYWSPGKTRSTTTGA